MVNAFEYFTGLGGFHVYSNTVYWKPHIGQKISLSNANIITITIISLVDSLKRTNRAVTVGHIPKELSRHTWYAIQEEAKFQTTAYDTKAQPSPLMQGGFEILMKVRVILSQEEKLLKFKAKVKLSTQWQANIMMTQSLY